MNERVGRLSFEERANLFSGIVRTCSMTVKGGEARDLQLYGQGIVRSSTPGVSIEAEEILAQADVAGRLEDAGNKNPNVRGALLAITNARINLGLMG